VRACNLLAFAFAFGRKAADAKWQIIGMRSIDLPSICLYKSPFVLLMFVWRQISHFSYSPMPFGQPQAQAQAQLSSLLADNQAQSFAMAASQQCAKCRLAAIQTSCNTD